MMERARVRPSEHPASGSGQGVPEFFERNRGIIVQWAGALIGAAAWFLHLNISYALVKYVCENGGMWLFHGATFATAALAAFGVLLSYRTWDRLRSHAETDPHLLTGADDPQDAVLGRARLMALGGMALSGFFLLIIVMAWIPDLVLSPCEGVPA